MVLIFEQNDITKIKVDAIVNAANNSLLGGGGVDYAIHKAAGPELLKECRTLGGCETGQAKITKGYNLPSKYVIHTVGPVYIDGKHNEKKLLQSCYENSLKIAKDKNIHSIAFPLISAGIYGYPKQQAIEVAVDSIKKFFENDDYEIVVKIVFYDKESIKTASDKIEKIEKYIDKNFEKHELLSEKLSVGKHVVKKEKLVKNKNAGKLVRAKSCKNIDAMLCDDLPLIGSLKTDKQEIVKKDELKPITLDKMIKNLDLSFSDSLIKIIDEKKLKDSEVYYKANMDRKLFSKIKNGSHPKKSTAISLCIGLGLNYKETNELLIKAGYILNNSDKFDVIISYYLKNKNYDIYEINETLLYYDQPQLGVV